MLDDVPEDIKQLLLDWPLINAFNLELESEVVIAGAYKGLAMDAIRRLYPGAKVHGFEPQPWAASEAAERLRRAGGEGWWTIEHYGLGVENGSFAIGEWHTDAASFIKTGAGTREQGTGLLVEFGKAMRAVDVDHIDLFILNVEGYEWQLLPYLISNGWIKKIDKLAVQFHLDMDGVDTQIPQLLAPTHILEYQSWPTWMYWEKR